MNRKDGAAPVTDTRSLISRALPVGPVNVGPTERIVTAGVGGALLLTGLDRGRTGGTLLALLGGVLLTRAVTGHCPAYRAMRGQAPGDGEDQRFAPGGLDAFERDDYARAELHADDFRPSYERRQRSPRPGEVAEVLGGPNPAYRPEGGVTREGDVVEEASEESFPASDSPAYSPGAAGGAGRR